VSGIKEKTGVSRAKGGPVSLEGFFHAGGSAVDFHVHRETQSLQSGLDFGCILDRTLKRIHIPVGSICEHQRTKLGGGTSVGHTTIAPAMEDR
jgi:hypothetical protein